MSTYTLYQGDCLEIMPTMPPGSIDAIITDLPYGTTACSWDTVLPFVPMWAAIKHVLKPRGVFVTTASQPFTSAIVMSNPDWFRCEWIWNKRKAGNIFIAEYQPMKIHENIIVFSCDTNNYYPIMKRRQEIKTSKNYGTGEAMGGSGTPENKIYSYTHTYPTSIIDVSNANQDNKDHPTQKPEALYRYLILTYTNPGETVLDMTAGSGTTGVACMQTGRNFVGIEKREDYYAIMERRVKNAAAQPLLPF